MLPCTRIPGGILYPPHGGIAAKRYKQAEEKDNETMIMKLLLHKDKEEK
jgi:hypothetical protein